mgnify:CR=1 FL=1
MKLEFEKKVVRSEILHCKISSENKEFISNLAEKHDQPLYVVVDKILDAVRKDTKK